MAVALASSQEVDSTASNLTSLVSSAVTVANGDVLVVKVATEDAACIAGTISGGAQTWTKNDSAGVSGSSCGLAIYTCTVSGSPGTVTVTVPFSGAARWHSMVVERYTGGKLATTPALVTSGRTGSGAPSATLTTTSAASIVSWVDGDWNATAPGTPAYRSSATQDGRHDKSGTSNYVAYYATQAAATAGAQTLGLTAPAGQSWTLLGIEVQVQAAAVNGSVTAVAATATATASPAPAVVGGVSRTVTGVVATATATAAAPVVTGATFGNVAAVVATATATTITPTLPAGGGPTTIFGASPPPGTQGLFTDGPIVVGDTFLIVSGATNSYTCTGARLYIDPFNVSGLPSTVTIWLIPSGSDLTVAPARTATVSVASGWVTASWAAYTMTAGLPITIAYQFGSGSTAYLAYPSPGSGRVASTADASVVMSADIDAGWRRGMYRYGTAETNGTALLWGVDVVMLGSNVADATVTAPAATATATARAPRANVDAVAPPAATATVLAIAPNVTGTGTARTIYGTGAPSGVITADDSGDLQLMHVFSDSAGGTLTKVRYYVNDAGMAALVGGSISYTIWRSGVSGVTTGTLLIPAAVGWVEDTLATPVTMLPSTLYGVSIALHPTTSATKYSFAGSTLPRTSATLTLSASGFNYSSTPIWATDISAPAAATGTASYLIDVAIDTPPTLVTATVATATATARAPGGTGNVNNATVVAVAATAGATTDPDVVIESEKVITGALPANAGVKVQPPTVSGVISNGNAVVLAIHAIATAVARGGTVPAALVLFSPPTHEEPMRTSVAPLRYYRLTWAYSVLRSGETFITVRSPTSEQLEACGIEGTDFFIGGYEYRVTADVAARLTDSGFTVTSGS